MTVTSPASGARAPLRRWMRRLAATGLAALVLLGTTGPAHATAAPAATDLAGSGQASVTLAPAADGIIRPGEALSVTVILDNGAATRTASGRVAFSIGDSALQGRADLDAWLAGDRDGVAVTEAAAGDVSAVASGSASSTDLLVPGDHPALVGRTPGVYPLVATVDVGGTPLVATSAMIVPDDAAQAPVGVVVPITAAPLTRGLLTADQLAQLTAADGGLTAQLDAVAGTAAILAVDPAIPAAIRVLGSAAPASAEAWLDRLMALTNSRFALQFGDADIAAQLQAGLPRPLEPTSLQAYMTASDFTPGDDTTRLTDHPAAEGATAHSTPSPTGTGGSSEPVYPDLAALTDVGATRQSVYWPVTQTAGADVTAALGTLGTPEAPALTLLASTSTVAGSGGATVPARADADGSSVLVYDAAVSSALRAASAEPDSTRRSASLAAATAHLALAAAEAGGRPIMVTLDRAADRTYPSLRAAVVAASQSPGVRAAELPELAAAAPEPTGVTSVEPDAARVADASALLQDETTLGRFSAILDDPTVLTGPERADVLQLLGAGWRADAAAAQAAVADHRSATRQTLDAVGILPPALMRLISFDAPLLPSVRNDLPWPVNVELIAQPDDPRLVIAESTTVRAQAASNTRVEIPVQTRLANGEVTVTVQLRSPAGDPVGATQRIDVEVRAEWETIGLVILVALLVAFIGVGIVRMVLHRRAARRTAAPAEEPAS